MDAGAIELDGEDAEAAEGDAGVIQLVEAEDAEPAEGAADGAAIDTDGAYLLSFSPTRMLPVIIPRGWAPSLSPLTPALISVWTCCRASAVARHAATAATGHAANGHVTSERHAATGRGPTPATWPARDGGGTAAAAATAGGGRRAHNC